MGVLVIFSSVLSAGVTLGIGVGDTVQAKLNGGLVNPKVGGIEVRLGTTTIGYDTPGLADDAVWAGCYLLDVQGMVTAYQSFCMDVVLSPAFSYTPHTAYAVSSDMEQMWGTYYDGVVNDAPKAAAFQLALWEMVHETSAYDIESGNFYLETLNINSPNNNGATWYGEKGLVDLANGFLDSSTWTSQADLVLLDDGTKQPFLVEVVPEPATMCLLGLGGLLLRRKK